MTEVFGDAAEVISQLTRGFLPTKQQKNEGFTNGTGRYAASLSLSGKHCHNAQLSAAELSGLPKRKPKIEQKTPTKKLRPIHLGTRRRRRLIDVFTLLGCVAPKEAAPLLDHNNILVGQTSALCFTQPLLCQRSHRDQRAGRLCKCIYRCGHAQYSVQKGSPS